MKNSLFNLSFVDFSKLDEEITKLRELRDSYKAANVALYGESLAELLNN